MKETKDVVAALLAALKEIADEADGCQCGSLGSQSARRAKVKRARALIAKVGSSTTLPSAQR